MSAQPRKKAPPVKGPERCHRCGLSRAEWATEEVASLCWPPGKGYLLRHQWKRREPIQRRKRDEERLAGWRKEAGP